ncbi:MAG: M23 family metallopeptidase [Sphingomonas sp.]
MKTALILVLALVAPSADAPADTIKLESRFAPHLDRTDRGISVRYELHVANHGKERVRLSGLRVNDTTTGASLLDLTGDPFRSALATGRSGCDAAQALVSPGGECLLYVDTNVARKAPRLLRTSIAFEAGTATGRAEVVLRVVDDAGPALGPPLGAGTWVAVHHADWARGHRRVFYMSTRGEVLPGRFAIDFVKVSSAGATSCGNPDLPSDTIGYGDPVLAVADGRIAAVRDGVPESATISGNPSHDRTTAPGNFVVLALGRGKFATYEHLRPGSLRVRVGQRVRRGMILGELGFTGDSTGPHLHFHVSDSVMPLGGEGLPFVFDRFSLWGDYPDIGQLGRTHWHALPPTAMQRVRPGANTVISFRASAHLKRSAGPDGDEVCGARGI